MIIVMKTTATVKDVEKVSKIADFMRKSTKITFTHCEICAIRRPE